MAKRAEKQYRMFVYAAIMMARKSATGKAKYNEIAPRLGYVAFNYMQWACAAGWLHCCDEYIYETRKTAGLTSSEVFNEINK